MSKGLNKGLTSLYLLLAVCVSGPTWASSQDCENALAIHDLPEKYVSALKLSAKFQYHFSHSNKFFVAVQHKRNGYKDRLEIYAIVENKNGLKTKLIHKYKKIRVLDYAWSPKHDQLVFSLTRDQDMRSQIAYLKVPGDPEPTVGYKPANSVRHYLFDAKSGSIEKLTEFVSSSNRHSTLLMKRDKIVWSEDGRTVGYHGLMDKYGFGPFGYIMVDVPTLSVSTILTNHFVGPYYKELYEILPSVVRKGHRVYFSRGRRYVGFISPDSLGEFLVYDHAEKVMTTYPIPKQREVLIESITDTGVPLLMGFGTRRHPFK